MGTSLWHYALWKDRQACKCTPRHTHTHAAVVLTSKPTVRHFHTFCFFHSICMTTVICTHDEGNASAHTNNILGEIIWKKSCAHINRNSTRCRRTDTDERTCVWQRDRGRHTVRWVRSNPRMETKNTSVHVRHVKEDTSWHLMPGKKITLVF